MHENRLRRRTLGSADAATMLIVALALAGCVAAPAGHRSISPSWPAQTLTNDVPVASQATQTAMAVETQPANDLYANLKVDETIPAGGSIDVPLSFEGSDLANVTAYTAAPEVSASFGGTALDSYTANGATALGKAFENPTDGPLHIVNSGTAEATVSLVVLVDSSRHVTVTPSTYDVAKGGSLSFDVSVTEATESDGATAYLEDPSGSKTPVSLTKLGPGHWTGQVSPPVSGNNTIYVETTGDRIRYDSSTVSVATGNLTLGTGFTERLVDTDNDGLANSLELTATITAEKPGSYVLVSHLVTSGGTEITVGGGDVSLVAGTQLLPIAFDGSTIYKSGLSGPYRLVHLTLVNTSFSPDLAEASATDLGSTKAYDYHVFQH